MPRKSVHIEPEEVERYGRLGCTVQELADLYGLALSSMSERLSKPPLREPWRRGLAEAKVSVRRQLMRIAQDDSNPKSVTACIWLSKVLCRDQEPPREAKVTNEITSTQTVFLARWGTPGGELPPTDDGELLEGEADEE